MRPTPTPSHRWKPSGAKADTLAGDNAGINALWGDKGKDTFVYDTVADAATPGGQGGYEGVNDFRRGQGDRIDFSNLPTGDSGDASFDFIGSSSFYEAGQVRYVKEGGHSLVQVNTDGDGQAEMEIWASGSDGAFDLKAQDFLL